jgi:hypothetical protein
MGVNGACRTSQVVHTLRHSANAYRPWCKDMDPQDRFARCLLAWVGVKSGTLNRYLDSNPTYSRPLISLIRGY